MTLGERIKQARESKNLSQEELAEKLGVSRQAVSKWENDNALPQGLNREVMSQVLGVDLSSGETADSSETGRIFDAGRISGHGVNRLGKSGWLAATVLMVLLIVVVCLWFNDRHSHRKNIEELTASEQGTSGTEDIRDSEQPEQLGPGGEQELPEPPAIGGLTVGSMYEELSAFGEPNKITPIDDEGTLLNKGYFVTVEYDDLTATVSAGTNFILTENSGIYSLSVFSDTYTDSEGLKVGDSKDKLIREYGLYEHELIRAGEYEEEYETLYRIHDDGIAEHELPDYDYFYPAENEDSPIILIYLIKDDCINGILLRHLTAG